MPSQFSGHTGRGELFKLHWHRWKQSRWRRCIIEDAACVLDGFGEYAGHHRLMEAVTFTPPRQRR